MQPLISHAAGADIAAGAEAVRACAPLERARTRALEADGTNRDRRGASHG